MISSAGVDGESTAGTELRRRPLFLLLALACFVAVVRAMLIGTLELFPDEALYAWIGERLPFSFCPHPPGVPLSTKLGIALLGKTEVGVRAVSFLFSMGMFVAVYALASAIGGSPVGFWATVAYSAVPIYVGIGVIATPDGAQLFLWTLALFFTWKALNSGRFSSWVAAGLSLGIGLHFKYIIILYYPALLLALLLVPEWRRHLRGRGLYASLGVATLLFVPVAAYGDYRTGWTALRYHLSDRQTFVLPSARVLLTYLGGHAGYYSPLLYVGCVWAIIWAGRKALRSREHKTVFLFCFAVVPFMFFLLIAAVTRRQLSREQWDAPAYLPALIAAVLMVQDLSSRKKVRVVVGATLSMGFLMTGLLLFEGVTGGISRAFGLTPAFSALVGWQSMSREADRQLELVSPDCPGFFLGNSFHLALEYAFYGKRTDRIYALEHSANGRYGLEVLLEQTGVAESRVFQERGNNGVFAMVSSADISERRLAKDLGRRDKLRRVFDDIEDAAPLVIKRYGHPLKVFRLFRCKNLKPRADVSETSATESVTSPETF